MAGKDITAKTLERYNDVFADILNTLLMDGRQTIQEDQLEDCPQEFTYTDADGSPRSMFRDTFKKYTGQGGGMYAALAYFGVENQASVERPMPLRVMGYTYTAYKKQWDDYRGRKSTLKKQLKEAEEQSDWDEAERIREQLRQLAPFKLVPVITMILNFSQNRWTEPLDLMGLAAENSPFRAVMENFSIRVYDMLYLPEQVQQNFRSDFGEAVRALTDLMNRKLDRYPKNLDHPVETLDMLYAFTKDARFVEIKESMVSEGGAGNMNTISDFLDELQKKNQDEAYHKGRDEGWNAGRTEGWNAGRTEGWNAGQEIKVKEMSISMFQNGIDLETIVKIAKEPLETVRRWVGLS